MENNAEERLQELRKKIDQIDKQVINLLNERARAAIEIGRLKNTTGMSFYAPDREKKIYDNIHNLNRGPLPDKVFFAIYRELMSGCLSLEKPLQISYLGPEGSFSHLAAVKKFGSAVKYIPLEDIRSVFIEVAQGHCDLGVVPIENSIAGTIIDTLDAFQELNVKICAELILPIHHHLLAKSTLEEVKVIYSKPEVFNQCRNWIRDHTRNIDIIPVPSTSRAAELVQNEPTSAAIASELSAKIYNLNIICKNIEDNPNNSTRFLVISKQSANRTGQDKTAITFITVHRAGALADVLDVFRQYGVNLTSIDSRPSRKGNWEYYFFIETEGHIEDENVSSAVEEAKKHCLELTVLGSFPRATEPLE